MLRSLSGKKFKCEKSGARELRTKLQRIRNKGYHALEIDGK